MIFFSLFWGFQQRRDKFGEAPRRENCEKCIEYLPSSVTFIHIDVTSQEERGKNTEFHSLSFSPSAFTSFSVRNNQINIQLA